MTPDALRSCALSLAARGLHPQPLAPGHVKTTGGQTVATFANDADAAFFLAAVAHLARPAAVPTPGSVVPEAGTDEQAEEVATREALGE